MFFEGSFLLRLGTSSMGNNILTFQSCIVFMGCVVEEC